MSALFHWASMLPEKFVVLAKANFTTTTPAEKTSMSSPWLVLVSLKLVWLVDQHST